MSMLKNLDEIVQRKRPVIMEKVRVGVSYIKIPISQDVTLEKDSKGNEIKFTILNGKKHEVIGISKDGKFMYVRVNKKEYPKSIPKSTPYFVFPEGSELEKLYGRRATKIKIVLLDNDLEKLIPNENEMYQGGQLVCWGDNETATRKNDDGTQVQMPCPCPYHFDFKEEIIQKVTGDLISAKRESRKFEGVLEVLVQGAWRRVKSYDREIDLYELEELEPQCDIRFRFRFVMPEVEGINVYVFEGGGDGNLATLIRNIEDLISVFGHVRGIPLYLCVRMAERNIKGIGIRKFPEVWLHLPYSVDNMLDVQTRKLIQIEMPESKVEELPEANELEETDFSVVDDGDN